VDRIVRRGRFSTACERADMTDTVHVLHRMEHEDQLEANSRSVEQHAGRSGWITYSAKQFLVFPE
jgi:hypothetical protein